MASYRRLAHDQPGATLGSYRIDRQLGRGGMGAVFLAYDSTLRRPVALKVMGEDTDDDTARSRLLHEARNAAALNHPNICTIHEVGHADGKTFIAMEYVDGRSLRNYIDDSALPIADVVRYGIQAADALLRTAIGADIAGCASPCTTVGPVHRTGPAY